MLDREVLSVVELLIRFGSVLCLCVPIYHSLSPLGAPVCVSEYVYIRVCISLSIAVSSSTLLKSINIFCSL